MEAHNVVTAGAFGSSSEGQPDRSATGLQYQAYMMSTRAQGSQLGHGLRSVPDPSGQFRSPPISRGQLGNGHAKSTFGDNDDYEDENEGENEV